MVLGTSSGLKSTCACWCLETSWCCGRLDSGHHDSSCCYTDSDHHDHCDV